MDQRGLMKIVKGIASLIVFMVFMYGVFIIFRVDLLSIFKKTLIENIGRWAISWALLIILLKLLVRLYEQKYGVDGLSMIMEELIRYLSIAGVASTGVIILLILL